MTRWLFYLRSFFPSWQLFDDVSHELRLEIRFGKDENLGGWRNALPPIQRSFAGLLLNSDAAFLHVCHNHLQHFHSDIEIYAQRPDELSGLATFELTQNLACYQIQNLFRAPPPFHYQFRLAAHSLQNKTDEIILTSLVYHA